MISQNAVLKVCHDIRATERFSTMICFRFPSHLRFRYFYYFLFHHLLFLQISSKPNNPNQSHRGGQLLPYQTLIVPKPSTSTSTNLATTLDPQPESKPRSTPDPRPRPQPLVLKTRAYRLRPTFISSSISYHLVFSLRVTLFLSSTRNPLPFIIVAASLLPSLNPYLPLSNALVRPIRTTAAPPIFCNIALKNN